MSLVTARSRQVEDLIVEVNSLVDELESLDRRAFTKERSKVLRSLVEEVLKRNSLFIEEKEVNSCMNRLKKVCLEKSLGDRSAIINHFIRPILTLRDPNGPLAHAMGFLSSRDLHSTSVV